MNKCILLDIVCCENIVQDLQCNELIGNGSKLPDHSLLNLKIKVGVNVDHEMDQNHAGSTEHSQDNRDLRFNLKRIPDNFMESNIVRQAFTQIIENIELCRERQEEIDKIYSIFCNTVYDEMQANIPFTTCNDAKMKKRFKNQKPYWDDELKQMWTDMVNKRKVVEKCRKVGAEKRKLHHEFVLSRNKFDKALRQKERAYQRKLMIEIEEVSSDPNKFWDHIKRLGQKRICVSLWKFMLMICQYNLIKNVSLINGERTLHVCTTLMILKASMQNFMKM